MVAACAALRARFTDFPFVFVDFKLIDALAPDEIIAVSYAKVWWKCPKGPDHEWQTACRQRVLKDTRCPFCANKRLSRDNSLAARWPKLAREWHPTKNGRLTPRDVLAGTNRLLFWRCAGGHTFRQKPAQRIAEKRGCPECARASASERAFKARTIVRSVADYPHLVAQWHPKLNRPLKPNEVSFGGKRQIWWRCSQGPDHVWLEIPTHRTRGSGCPFCAGKRVSVTNSLATRFPKVARQWHATKNKPLTPKDVTYGSTRRCWWRCTVGHEWQVSPSSRVSGASITGCPYCRPRTRRSAAASVRRR